MTLRYHINKEEKKRNLKNKEIESMNEKLKTWSVLNTDMMTLSNKVVEDHCFKKGEQWEQKIGMLR